MKNDEEYFQTQTHNDSNRHTTNNNVTDYEL